MMILEYCSKGVLKLFLESIKSKMSVDIDERLYRIVFGICLGMDFLASKKVSIDYIHLQWEFNRKQIS